MKKPNRKMPKQYYELILFKQGEIEERIETDRFSTYKGEFERLEAVTKSSPLYELVVNLKDSDRVFEKRIY